MWVVSILLCGTAALETFLKEFNVFQILTYSKYFEINLFKFKLLFVQHCIPCIKIGLEYLNAFLGGQALATALKSNSTVVDINLAYNPNPGDEKAEVRWTWVQGE